MESLNEIATTGAPGIVTAMGMGTVFSCLILLYFITRAMGSGVSRLVAFTERKNSAPEPVPEPTSSNSSVESSQAESPAAGITAAIVLALVRHRSARVAPVLDELRGPDAWKVAGRMHSLRDQ